MNYFRYTVVYSFCSILAKLIQESVKKIEVDSLMVVDGFCSSLQSC